MILRARDSLKQVFEGYGLFRIGGDELLALCPGIMEQELEEKVRALRLTMKEHEVVMAVGAVWRADCHDGIDRLLSEADRLMYADKAAYYATLKAEK